MRVVGYVRVSSNNRDEWEPSRQIQEEAIRGWCRAHDHRLVELFYDEGISGANALAERRGLPEALNVIKAGRAGGLVVRGLDRLSRDLMIQEAVLADLWGIRPDVEAYSTSDGEARNCTRDDPDDPGRKFVRHVLGATSAYVRDLTVARLRAGKRAKAARGGFTGGRTPYGWRSIDRELAKAPAEQRAIARAVELAGAGRSLRQIAVALTAEGHRPRGRGWHPTTVARILERAGEGSL